MSVRPKKTIPDFLHHDDKIVMVTAYDYPGAAHAERAGVDIILVGDSLGNVVLGYESTTQVTLDDIVHHAKAARRGAPNTFLVADMPFGTYHTGLKRAREAAVRLIQESGADAVKVEGATPEILEVVRVLSRNGIPVMGHVGLTPQTATSLGGLKVQGKTVEHALRILREARDVEAAGAFAVVLEAVPNKLAGLVTQRLRVPTIGIGAGPDCRGQVLVYHDLLGVYEEHKKLAKRYAELGRDATAALEAYAREVREGAFPQPDNGFLMKSDVLREVRERLEHDDERERPSEQTLEGREDAESIGKLY
ncbi:3-methyl-2-oxobutanoate hydroxymethyltransferase [Deinococcus yavapaiensis]|nr:3-methyl-2-oxobutanoate hydroxymethyltransferase [Deinococcus yavapaiensis]